MEDKSASEQIDDIIKLYGGWKGKNIAHLRSVITAADPEIVEEIKWKMRTRPEGLPVWSHNGIVCFLETFTNDQKLVFFQGINMKDPKKLFNARLKSTKERAIEFHEDTQLDEAGLSALVREAVELNKLKKKK